MYAVPPCAVDWIGEADKEPIPVGYRVTIEQGEDGAFVAECPALPGCISQGKTRTEALVNIKDAFAGYLESLRKHDEPIPPPIHEDTGEVAIP